MGTPGHVLAECLRSFMVVLSVVLGVGVCVSRVYVFYESYWEFRLKQIDETWLGQQCKDPEFYSNMRQHTDLCTQVSIGNCFRGKKGAHGPLHAGDLDSGQNSGKKNTDCVFSSRSTRGPCSPPSYTP